MSLLNPFLQQNRTHCLHCGIHPLNADLLQQACGDNNNQHSSQVLSHIPACSFFFLFFLDAECQWAGPFCFIQAADPQLGLMKAWRDGDCDSEGAEWAEEVALTQRAVEAVNQLQPRPRFMVLCGDLVHAMPGMNAAQEQCALLSSHTECEAFVKCIQYDCDGCQGDTALRVVPLEWLEAHFYNKSESSC